MTRRVRRMSRFFSGSTSFSGANITRRPVKTRKAPKTTSTHWYWISSDPTAMKMPRKTSAPRMPKKSTRCCSSVGMRK
jgi:hypothetical protein